MRLSRAMLLVWVAAGGLVLRAVRTDSLDTLAFAVLLAIFAAAVGDRIVLEKAQGRRR